ncbi:Nucleic acid-binding, OB-fold containing protein [Quillaja saponaria]|uniref:Nucleic acid-binding, OB-fold containing protein n=1 Tax=Quillaja saponaria TaxID=32244 RepID=A0AAD7KXZ2_QUISA|nr:Nucleic acid-binding, OB-fold containing protein [Quillaja saponaria]
MEVDKPATLVCTVLAINSTDLCYRVCSICERTLADNPINGPSSPCKFCNFNAFNPGSSGSKRLFRVLMSIATDTKVFTVICFDRAARVLFGCSADEFFDFAKLHPFVADNVGKILEGEMFRMTLAKPKNGNAQHLRVVSVFPLRSVFQPAIETLRELYNVRAES